MRLKDFDKIDLPREKFLKYGVFRLKDYELLAIILGSGVKGLNVISLSRKILMLLKKNADISIKSLLEVKGLGKVKAMQILSVLEFSKRFSGANKSRILGARDIFNLCSDFSSSKKEQLAVFYIDSQGKLIERKIVSVGTLDKTLIHPREVFEPAISLSASSIVLAHNHPSGDLTPSVQDTSITKVIRNAGLILGIELKDHVIVSRNGFASLRNSL